MMNIKYRNTKTGRIVDIPADDSRVKTLDAGKRWERIEDTEPVDREPESAPDEPMPAEVRTWARENGIEVPARGRLSPEVIELYKAARDEAAAEAAASAG